ncbi:Uncharacterised protein [Metamycoplasma arthritidis]|uniref:Uncharacterized protein n=1 Tax=Metamycoplasma arthritidis (strain 158L3-1) TaxID=243272 RepID=B3PM18_META1|nr:hypothetical protein [Metamycoplasma arthritidis]ACF07070.1 hypothetical protein MARTH_orf133 [Metamycoplasma arthritidis 158L3-1]VEU78598.1 Uncharacterised protein [Metamycoplasma arthritidis]
MNKTHKRRIALLSVLAISTLGLTTTNAYLVVRNSKPKDLSKAKNDYDQKIKLLEAKKQALMKANERNKFDQLLSDIDTKKQVFDTEAKKAKEAKELNKVIEKIVKYLANEVEPWEQSASTLLKLIKEGEEIVKKPFDSELGWLKDEFASALTSAKTTNGKKNKNYVDQEIANLQSLLTYTKAINDPSKAREILKKQIDEAKLINENLKKYPDLFGHIQPQLEQHLNHAQEIFNDQNKKAKDYLLEARTLQNQAKVATNQAFNFVKAKLFEKITTVEAYLPTVKNGHFESLKITLQEKLDIAKLKHESSNDFVDLAKAYKELSDGYDKLKNETNNLDLDAIKARIKAHVQSLKQLAEKPENLWQKDAILETINTEIGNYEALNTLEELKNIEKTSSTKLQKHIENENEKSTIWNELKQLFQIENTIPNFIRDLGVARLLDQKEKLEKAIIPEFTQENEYHQKDLEFIKQKYEAFKTIYQEIYNIHYLPVLETLKTKLASQVVEAKKFLDDHKPDKSPIDALEELQNICNSINSALQNYEKHQKGNSYYELNNISRTLESSLTNAKSNYISLKSQYESHVAAFKSRIKTIEKQISILEANKDNFDLEDEIKQFKDFIEQIKNTMNAKSIAQIKEDAKKIQKLHEKLIVETKNNKIKPKMTQIKDEATQWLETADLANEQWLNGNSNPYEQISRPAYAKNLYQLVLEWINAYSSYIKSYDFEQLFRYYKELSKEFKNSKDSYTTLMGQAKQWLEDFFKYDKNNEYGYNEYISTYRKYQTYYFVATVDSSYDDYLAEHFFKKIKKAIEIKNQAKPKYVEMAWIHEMQSNLQHIKQVLEERLEKFKKSKIKNLQTSEQVSFESEPDKAYRQFGFVAKTYSSLEDTESIISHYIRATKSVLEYDPSFKTNDKYTTIEQKLEDLKNLTNVTSQDDILEKFAEIAKLKYQIIDESNLDISKKLLLHSQLSSSSENGQYDEVSKYINDQAKTKWWSMY